MKKKNIFYLFLFLLFIFSSCEKQTENINLIKNINKNDKKINIDDDFFKEFKKNQIVEQESNWGEKQEEKIIPANMIYKHPFKDFSINPISAITETCDESKIEKVLKNIKAKTNFECNKAMNEIINICGFEGFIKESNFIIKENLGYIGRWMIYKSEKNYYFIHFYSENLNMDAKNSLKWFKINQDDSKKANKTIENFNLYMVNLKLSRDQLFLDCISTKEAYEKKEEENEEISSTNNINVHIKEKMNN